MTGRNHGEVPPTAGLPLRLSDLLPGRHAQVVEILAQQLGTPPLLLTCSGTVALLLALKALSSIAPDRRVVVVPAYTCPLVAIVVHSLGLELRLCDSHAGHFDMDPHALAAACDTRTLAVIPTHIGGLVADVDAAVAAARAVGAWVIEDAAQALGARDHDASVGLRGDVGFFSLSIGKGLSIYEGGLLVARDAPMREALARMAAETVPYSLPWELRRSVELLGLAVLYRPGGLRLAYGWPLRRALRRGDPVVAVGDDFPRTIPLHQVGRWRQGVGARAAVRLPEFLAHGRRLAQARIARLRAIPRVHVFGAAAHTQGSWPFLLLSLPSAETCDAALGALWTKGLGVSRLFVHALPDYAYLADRVPQVAMPNARAFARRSLTISNSPWLDDAGFAQICRTLEHVLR